MAIKTLKSKKAKYVEVFQRMLVENANDFAEFKKIHDKFAGDPIEYRKEFNQEGEKINVIIKNYLDILCGRSEGNGFGNYSQNLADLFMNAVRQIFSEIDEIGVE